MFAITDYISCKNNCNLPFNVLFSHYNLQLVKILRKASDPFKHDVASDTSFTCIVNLTKKISESNLDIIFIYDLTNPQEPV